MGKKYYEAYNERYKAAHEKNLCWLGEEPSPIVSDILEQYGIRHDHKILEIGCGEGRDAAVLLQNGYDLFATDVSEEAIRYCQQHHPDAADRFAVLDCVAGDLNQTFDFIYAVAVVHMLVPDEDRNAFYRFVRTHLNQGGIALICTMGDGTTERSTDISTAFELSERNCDGQTVIVANTSCRMVSTETFHRELSQNGLEVVENGFTSVPLQFSSMLYAVVKTA